LSLFWRATLNESAPVVNIKGSKARCGGVSRETFNSHNFNISFVTDILQCGLSSKLFHYIVISLVHHQTFPSRYIW